MHRLGPKERKLIEKLIHDRVIKVVVATTTLAAGINLPAREVIVTNIIQNAQFGEIPLEEYEKADKIIVNHGRGLLQPLSANMLFQMLGRAGRPGYDPVGIGTIILKDREELEQVRVRYFQRELNTDGYLVPKYADLVSQLNYKRALEELILLIIGSGIANSVLIIKKFLNRTFFAFNFRMGGFQSAKLVQYLLINKMDMAYFLDLHGTPPSNSDYQVQLMKASAEDIQIKITMGDALYYPRISLRDGFLCSCARPPSPFLRGDAHSTFMGKLCTHQTILISYLTRILSRLSPN